MPDKTRSKDYDGLAVEAIRQLERDGLTATVANVLEITGGSRRDMAPAVRRGKERVARERELQLQAPEMPEVLSKLAADFWTKAYSAASEDFRKLRHIMQKEADEFVRNIEELEDLLASVEVEAEDWKHEAQQRASENDHLTAEVMRLRTDLSVANVRLRERDELAALFALHSNPSHHRQKANDDVDAVADAKRAC